MLNSLILIKKYGFKEWERKVGLVLLGLVNTVAEDYPKKKIRSYKKRWGL
jgi:hypothetical protein